MTSAIFVDTFTRKITVSTVSVSQVEGKGLVLRYGAQVGQLYEMTADSRFFRNEDLPVIVAARGYKAQSSAGFVEVVSDWRGQASRVRAHVLGVQGFPWQKTCKGLSVLGNPLEVLVLRPGTNICQLETHARREAGKSWHSNTDCAEAAAAGVKLRALARPKSVFVLEGQSDYAQAWELAAFGDAYEEPFNPEFPEEFRAERFRDENIVFAGLRACARRKGKKGESDQERIEGTVFIYLNLILADESKFWADGKGWKDSLLPWYTLHLVGPKLREIAEYMALTLRGCGWRLGMDQSLGNHFLQAINKDGKVVVYGWGAVHGPKEYEQKLIELLDIAPEAKAELLAQLETRDPSERAWTSHVGA